MATEWYYSKGQQQLGPVSGDVLQQLASSGQLSPTDLVWKDGMQDWMPASKIKGLFPYATASGPPPVGQAQQPYSPPGQPVPGPYSHPGQAAPEAYPPAGQATPNAYSPPGQNQYIPVQPGGVAVQQMGESFSNKAKTSMILAIVGLLVFGIILGPVAIVYAAQAMSGMSKSGNKKGKGMAVAGLVIGIIDIIGALFFLGAMMGK